MNESLARPSDVIAFLIRFLRTMRPKKEHMTTAHLGLAIDPVRVNYAAGQLQMYIVEFPFRQVIESCLIMT